MTNERTEIIEAAIETARIMQQAKKLERETEGRITGGEGGVLASLLVDPAGFWAACTDDEMRGMKVIDPAGKAGVLALRQMGADLKAGNFDSVRESLLGQGAWLGALAVSLAKEAQGAKGSGKSDLEKRARLLRLALQAQAQGVRTLCSAAALGAAGVEVRD